MNKTQYIEFTKKFIEKNKNCFIATHDCHDKYLVKAIENTGLCVSYNPYGKKVERLKKSDGSIDLSNDFMATMNHLKTNQDCEKCLCLPTSPLLIVIPEEILKLENLQGNENDAHQVFCGYGFQTLIKSIGTEGISYRRGAIIPKDDEKDANVRLLPKEFVYGHIDMDTNKFIQNPKCYEKLSKKEKDEFKQKILDIINKNQSNKKDESQPGDE